MWFIVSKLYDVIDVEVFTGTDAAMRDRLDALSAQGYAVVSAYEA